MGIKKSFDHPLIGIGFAILGTLLGVLLIEMYWHFYRGFPDFDTFWTLFEQVPLRANLIILTQVPNVVVFFSFYQTKRDRSAYGALAIIILALIPVIILEIL